MQKLIEELKNYQKILPEEYLKEVDEEDLINIYLHLNKLKKNNKNSASFKGDIERFFLHRYSFQKLSKRLNRLLPFETPSTQLIKIVVNQKNNFMLTTYYHEINRKIKYKKFNPPTPNDKEILYKNSKILKETDFVSSEKEITIRLINISSITVFRNLLETLEKSETRVNYIKIWIQNTGDKKVKNFHKITIRFENFLTEEETTSLKEDFLRYFQHYIKPRSIFDMIGPPMIGPSSSHTAGANRIGQLARNFFISLKPYILKNKGNLTPHIEVYLYSSFADTGIGHKTPHAIGAGLLGYDTDYPDMTKYGFPEYISKKFKLFEEINIKFHGYKIGKKIFPDTNQSNVAEIILYLENEKISLTGFSIGGGNIEIRYINDIKLPEPVTGKKDFSYTLYLKNGKVSGKIKKIYNTGKISEKTLPFNTMEEFSEYQKKTQKTIIDIIIETETTLQNSTREEIYSTLKKYWQIMKDSIKQPLENPKKSDMGISGTDAKKIFDFKSSVFKDDIYKKSLYYSVAVNEFNSQSGLIVACPTAGSAGIVPGVLKAYQETVNCSDEKIYNALLVSGFLGMILFDDVTTAGADFGCQAEIGAAAAMAAAAITYLENGSPKAVIHAFTLAIKNSLGLVCDPVGGLVEIPCIKRNGIYSSMALSCATMALSGVRSFVSPDEVILAMQEIGNKLNKDYKETSRGGLAKTRDAKEINLKMKKIKDEFFN